jgi:hypothetical protein
MNELMPARNPLRDPNMLQPGQTRFYPKRPEGEGLMAKAGRVMSGDFSPVMSYLYETIGEDGIMQLLAKGKEWGADKLPGGDTVYGMVGSKLDPYTRPEPDALPELPKETVVAKTQPRETMGVNSRSVDPRGVLSSALNIRPNLSPEAQGYFDDLANSSEGRALAERIAAGDAGAAEEAKRKLMMAVRGGM